MKEIVLSSGRKLKVGVAPFRQSLELHKSLAKILERVDMDWQTDVDFNFFKRVYCAAISSDDLEEKIYVCMPRSLYQGVKIDPASTFESEEAREDYLEICFHILQENVSPFVKGLLQKLPRLKAIAEVLGSK